jgi:hypothetical protein
MSQFSPSMLNVLNGLLVGQGLQVSPTLSAAIAAYRALPTVALAQEANGLKYKVDSPSVLTEWDAVMAIAPALVDYLPTQSRFVKGWGSDPLTFDIPGGGETYLDIAPIPLTSTGVSDLVEQWASVLTFDGKVKKLCSLILAMNGHMTQLNEILASTSNSQSVAKTVLFRGADFQATGGLSAVSSDLAAFGSDLQKTGKIIDFSRIGELGDPALLLETMQNLAGGLTRGVAAALALAGITPEEIAGIGTATFDNQTKAQMYRGMALVSGTELEVVKAIFRATVEVETMAELLDLKKLLPQSYQTLLAITDDLIYTNGTITPALANTPTNGQEFVTSKELTISNKRFRESLLQVAGIKDQTAPGLSSVLSALALNTELPLVTALTVPMPDDTNVVAALGQGTGEQGLYRFRDMIGTITGFIHDLIFTEVTASVAGTNTTTVETQLTRLRDLLAMTNVIDSEGNPIEDGIHTDEVDATPGPAVPPTESWIVFEGIEYAHVPFGGNPWNDPVDTLLNDLQTAMTSWATLNPAAAALTAPMMIQAAAQVDREITARNAYEEESNFAFAATRETRSTLSSFAVALHQFGQSPDLMETVESIVDTSLTGQSIIATMREGKNLKALAAKGIITDLIVPSTLM